jgi:DNA topoisomerase VI subunit B
MFARAQYIFASINRSTITTSRQMPHVFSTVLYGTRMSKNRLQIA